MRACWTCLLAAGLGVPATAGPDPAAQPQPRDYKDVSLKELGVEPVPAKKDPKTGFVVGGQNPTSRIAQLPEINGRKVAKLEKDMRPGALSRSGFLGRDESLLEVLAADNRFVVDEHGLTHQELALHLRVLAAVGLRQLLKKADGSPVTYHGRRFRVEVALARGYQDSPFSDDTRSNTDVTLHNLDNGKKLKYSLLVPLMMERYGFYEGHGTPYRVEPRAVLEVLDFLPAKAKKR